MQDHACSTQGTGQAGPGAKTPRQLLPPESARQHLPRQPACLTSVVVPLVSLAPLGPQQLTKELEAVVLLLRVGQGGAQGDGAAQGEGQRSRVSDGGRRGTQGQLGGRAIAPQGEAARLSLLQQKGGGESAPR